MKSFCYKFRDVSGAICSGNISATNRKEALALLANKGIRPISIKEAVVASSSWSFNEITRSCVNRRFALISILFIVLIAIGAILLMVAQTTKDTPKVKISPTVESATNLATGTQLQTNMHHDAFLNVSNINGKADVTNVVAATTSSQTVSAVTLARSPALKKKVLEDGTVVWEKRKPLFSRHIDTVVAAAIRPGGFSSGLRHLLVTHSDQQIIEMLKTVVDISKDDSEELIERKLDVQQMKEKMLKYIEAGHSVAETIADMDKILRVERKERSDAEKELRRLLAEGDIDAAREYVRTKNKTIRESGGRELYLPRRYRKEGDEDLLPAPLRKKLQTESQPLKENLQ